MTKTLNLSEKVIQRTDKSITRSRYKTTSFTLLKDDYDKFKSACAEVHRTPSIVIREMILIFIEETKTK